MPIYALGDKEPSIATDAYVHPEAVIIGEVTIGSESLYGRVQFFEAMMEKLL